MPNIRAGLRFLSAEVRGLQGAVYVLATFALLSSLLALLRDRLLAAVFGAGVELDVYYAAFRIPDLIFVGIGALVSVYMLIPELSARDREEQKRYIDTVAVGFFGLSIVLCAIAALLLPRILAALYPALASAGFMATLVDLSRIMLLQPILLGFSNILAAITQTRYRYTLYAASPLFYNLGIIFGLLVLYPSVGLPGLAWGVVLGAALHAGIQLPAIVGDGFFRSVPRLWQPHDLLRTAAHSIPRALALSMNQIGFLGLTAIASTLAAGSISVFIFANNLGTVPLSIIGASYSVAAFPALALALQRGRREEFIGHIATAARYVLFWSVPATALIIVLRAHIVRTVLGSGAFNWTDTRLTAAALAILSLTLVCHGLMLLLIRGYYASGRTYTPLLFSSAIAAGTILLSLLILRVFDSGAALSFVQSFLRLEGVAGANMLALPLGYALSIFLGTMAILLHFERTFGGFLKQVRQTAGHSLSAALAAGAAAYGTLSVLGPLTFSSTLLSVATRGFVAGSAGIAAGAVIYALLRSPEFSETADAIRSKLWRGWRGKDRKAAVVASAEEAVEI